MSVINKAIPNMFNGVSQQAASLRHPTQCELMDNGYPSIATGLRKRPPTKHRAKLKNTTATDAYVYTINRDVTSRYDVIITSGSVEVFDLATGAVHTVTYPDGTGYLTSAKPREDFVALTVADYTFIVNKTVIVAMGGAVSAGAIAGTVQQFSALPGAPAVGTIYRVEGTPDTEFDDYYVKWTGAVWVETIKPGLPYQFDAATMPFKLIKTGATTWECRKNVWDDRLVGDDNSAPLPSFIGSPIFDIFFTRNRLGFLSDENTILSRTGIPFNFWNETATAELDTDPVDYFVNTNSGKVAILNYAVPFNKALMLFSDQTQFEFTAGEVLTPKSPRADAVTSFESAKLCRPVEAGNALFFAVANENSTAIREYFVDGTTISNDASDITAHVSTYIPKDVFKVASCTADDALLVLSLTARNKVWCYKFYWNDKDEKVQSAWGQFVLDAGDTVLNVDFIGNVSYWTIQRADGIYLETMGLEANVTDGSLGFLVHLDRRVELTGTYDAVNDWTTWNLPYSDASSFTVVLGDAFGVDSANSLNTTRPSATTIRSIGRWDTGNCYIGRNYTLRYRFSTIYVRDDNGVAITAGTLKIKRMYVNYDKTGYFRAEVTPKGRSTYTYEFTGKYVGDAVVGATSIGSGTFPFPVQTENVDATIDLVSDSYLPCFFQSAEWEGEFTMKANRR